MKPADLHRFLAPMRRKVQLMIGRAVIAAVDDSAQVQSMQVSMLADETHDQLERFMEYGFTSVPYPGAEAVVALVGGVRIHGIIIGVDDRRYRLVGLAAGEVAIYDDQGQKIHLTRDGIVLHSDKGVKIEAPGADVAITCDNFTVSASAKIKLAGDDIEIGNGATLQAARKTDAVAGAVISGGSTKVKVA